MPCISEFPHHFAAPFPVLPIGPPRFVGRPVAALQPDQTPRENGIFARLQRGLSEVSDFFYEEETSIKITPELTKSDLACLAAVFVSIAMIYSETQTD